MASPTLPGSTTEAGALRAAIFIYAHPRPGPPPSTTFRDLGGSRGAGPRGTFALVRAESRPGERTEPMSETSPEGAETPAERVPKFKSVTLPRGRGGDAPGPREQEGPRERDHPRVGGQRRHGLRRVNYSCRQE